MKQLAFFIDIDKCIFCQSCLIACNIENRTGKHKRRRKITLIDHFSTEEIKFTMSCNHCETPACMTVCPKNCIRKLRNGIVIINKKHCNGCGRCASVCPFSAVKINPITNKADKCDMCYERQQKGKDPVCVEACIANAISIKDIREADSLNYKIPIEKFSMKSITNPSIRFKYEKKGKQLIWSKKGVKNE